MTEDEKALVKVWESTKSFIDEINGDESMIELANNNIFYNQFKLDDLFNKKIPSTDVPNPFIELVNNDPLKEAKILVEDGYKTLVMNPGKTKIHGGGVTTGKKTIEADIYRRTTIASHINRVSSYRYYPMARQSGILTKDVIVFRDIDYEYLDNIFHTDFLTIGAVDKPFVTNTTEGNVYGSVVERKTMEIKIELFFQVAFLNGYRAVVITDIGCRDENNPHPILEVAEIIKKMANKYKHYFDKIIVAVMSDIDNLNDPTSLNFDIFKMVWE